MKKGISVLMALLLVLSLSAAAYADGGTSVANGGSFDFGVSYSGEGAPNESFEVENISLVSSDNVAKAADTALMPTIAASSAISSGSAAFSVTPPPELRRRRRVRILLQRKGRRHCRSYI